MMIILDCRTLKQREDLVVGPFFEASKVGLKTIPSSVII